MKSTSNGWTIIDEEVPILTYEYSFGPSTTTTLVTQVLVDSCDCARCNSRLVITTLDNFLKTKFQNCLHYTLLFNFLQSVVKRQTN